MRIIAALILCISASAFVAVPGDNVPEAVLKAFDEMYAGAADVQWEQEDGTWEAEFVIGDVAMEAAFQADGVWLESEAEIGIDEVPASVMANLAKYPDYEVVQAVKVKSADIKLAYELTIQKSGDRLDMLIDADGRVLKMEAEDDENR